MGRIIVFGCLVLALGNMNHSNLQVRADPSAEEGAENLSVLRVAVFNIWELSREKLDQIDDDGHGTHTQLQNAAEIIQRVRPGILLVNEIDFDGAAQNARLFAQRYLQVSQAGQAPIDYSHIFFAPTNTGVPSGLDLNRDGKKDGPDDAYGFGRYPGQYGMALLSQWPMDEDAARTFRKLLWQSQPGNLMPDGRHGKPAWYEPEQGAIFRLSSKSHWDVPVRIGDFTLHVLACHPTPPVFDGEEDRNGRRNFDEIRLFADYLSGGEAAAYVVDDRGIYGGLPEGESFVVLGDLNADPWKDQAVYGRTAISQLLEHPRVQDPQPLSLGGKQQTGHRADAYPGPNELRTAQWGRLDYALPSHDLLVSDAGVYWPPLGHPQQALVEGRASSDHRLVWIDIRLPEPQNLSKAGL